MNCKSTNMKLFKFVIGILFTICIFISCSNSIPFNKKEWNTSILKEDEVSTTISKQRYGMTLWLIKNYDFYEKSTDDIIDKFFEDTTEQMRADIKSDKKIFFLIREKNLNKFIGFARWRQTDWLNIYFDKNNNVSKICMVNYNPENEKWTEIPIHQKKLKWNQRTTIEANIYGQKIY